MRLREQATQDIGQPKRGLERVHLQTRAERNGFEAFANQARDPREQRQRADRGQRPEQIHRRELARAADGVCVGRKFRSTVVRNAISSCASREKWLLCPVFFRSSSTKEFAWQTPLRLGSARGRLKRPASATRA